MIIWKSKWNLLIKIFLFLQIAVCKFLSQVVKTVIVSRSVKMGMTGGDGGWLSSFITGMANFSAQYNFQSIAIVLIIMSQTVCTSDDGNCKLGEQQEWVEGTSSAVIFVGAVMGQLCMGFLGDFLNRSQALSVTLLIATISALLSSVAPSGDSTSIYSTVIAFRFFLGIGLGGVFPLSATKSGEDSAKSSGGGKVNSVGTSWAFFWQVPGLLGPWFLGYIFTLTSLSISARWRLILGIGAIPSFLSIVGLTYESYLKNSKDNHRSSLVSLSSAVRLSVGIDSLEPNKHKISLSEVWTHLQNRQIRINLLACGGSWFLYDVVVYGLGLLAAFIIDDISNGDDNVSSDANVRNICSKQLIALCLSTPTSVLSILILPYFGLKRLQTIAFATISCAFLVMGGTFVYLKDTNPEWLFVLYCLCSMSCNFGIGITTFSMPAALFKHDIRSTFNGIACAMGKTGAIVGAYSFYDIALATSYEAVLYMCSGIAFCGLLLTYYAIDQNEIDFNTSEGQSAVIIGDGNTSGGVSNNNKTENNVRPSEIEFTDSMSSENPLQTGVHSTYNSGTHNNVNKTTDNNKRDVEAGEEDEVVSSYLEPVIRSKMHSVDDNGHSTTHRTASMASHVEL